MTASSELGDRLPLVEAGEQQRGRLGRLAGDRVDVDSVVSMCSSLPMMLQPGVALQTRSHR